MARLRILTGKRSGEVFELEPGENLIGTGRAAKIQLREKDVGFKHARILVEDGGVFVEDLRSKETLVNGEKITDRVVLRHRDQLQIGEASLEVDLEAAAAAAEAAPAPVAEPEREEPRPTRAFAPEPEPAPSAAPSRGDAPARPTRAMTPVADASADEPVPSDPDILREMVRDLQRKLREKTQEAEALSQALESSSSTEGGGYSDSVADDLEGRILELQHIADEQAARVFERDEEIKQLRGEVDVLNQKIAEHRQSAERQEQGLTDAVVRSHEKVEEWRAEVKGAQDEVARFEQVNAELLLENEELKEKLDALHYQVEQEAANRGALVRERLVELRQEAERLEASNAEMRTLVEAYEEKIDELDERVEELEGENEALEQMLQDVRDELNKAKQERETMVKTLRQKLQRTEQLLQGAHDGRARAEARSSELQDQTATA